MVAKSFLPSLIAAAVIWADHIALASATCLSPLSPGGVINQEICCLGEGNGRESVNGVVFEYLCGYYADTTSGGGHHASNAYECARRCAEDEACHASSWDSSRVGTSNCYMTTVDNYRDILTPGAWVLLKKTAETEPPTNPDPVPNCQEEIEQAVVECEVAAEVNCNGRVAQAVSIERLSCQQNQTTLVLANGQLQDQVSNLEERIRNNCEFL